MADDLDVKQDKLVSFSVDADGSDWDMRQVFGEVTRLMKLDLVEGMMLERLPLVVRNQLEEVVTGIIKDKYQHKIKDIIKEIMQKDIFVPLLTKAFEKEVSYMFNNWE